MKRTALTTALGLAVAVPLLSSLSGCASVAAPANTSFEVDATQVAAIERAARHAGVQVIWVNQPLKKPASAAGG